MATATTQVIAITGLAETFVAASTIDKAECGDRTFLHVKNVNAATRTITLATPGTVGGNAIADAAIVIPANTGDLLIGPLTRAIYGDSDGNVGITWSATTDVTIAAVRI